MGCGATKQPKIYKPTQKRLSDNLALNPGLFLSKNRGKLSSSYVELKTLGSGAFAEVKLCNYIPTSQLRAVKIIHKAGLHQQQVDEEYMLKEISVLIGLDHPNILRCYEIFEDTWRFYVSMEYCEGGELFSKIVSMRKFTESQAAKIMHQLLSAISYCHEKLVIHRDLKPENILLDNKNGDLTIKVADFGSSCFLDTSKRLSGCFGSAYYVAPEVLGEEYNEKCDIWSCGVIMFILLTGKPPYPGRDSKFILNLVRTAPLTISAAKLPGVSAEAVDLLRKMLEIHPRNRISASEAVNHPWIINYRNSLHSSDISHSLESLEKFNCSAKLKDAVHIFLATQVISHEESTALRSIFQVLDTNSDGKISRDELMAKYLEQFDEQKARETVDKIMKEVDKNQSGDIDYAEFLSACMNYNTYLSKENLEAAFKMFDIDSSGYITADELMAILGKGRELPHEVWQEILREVDQNGDGVIDLKEFINLMTNKL